MDLLVEFLRGSAMHKILRAITIITLLVIIGLTLLFIADRYRAYHDQSYSDDAIALFIASEEFVAQNFHDRARAMDRAAHYQAGFEGIRLALLKQKLVFATTTIPQNTPLSTLQQLFAAELERAALQSNGDPWPLAYAAAEAMCASFHDSHTAIMRPTADFSLQVTSRMLEDNLGLFSVRAFDPKYMHYFPDIVRDFELRGCRGIILDLRDSVGGDMNTMFALTSCLVPPGTPLFATKNDYAVSLAVALGHYHTQLPLVVLVNGQSYSAAEMLAEVLQRSDRARLIGERTAGHFGVATGFIIDPVRVVFLQVTTHRHLTFGGASLEGVGVLPDIVVADAPTQTGGAQLDAARTELERLIALRKK